MNFYKVHAAKFKGSKVIFVPEQFDEIGPDAFSQSDFEVIVLSKKVKTIKNHAFSDLKKCKVYIPRAVSRIEERAFEDMDESNEFYCVNGSEAYKICVENGLKVNEDIEWILEYAQSLKVSEPSEQPVTEPKKSEPSEQPVTESKKSEPTPVEPVAEPESAKPEEEEPPTVPDTDVKEQPEEDTVEEKDESLFIDKFGIPPIVSVFTEEGEQWKSHISILSTDEIIEAYDSGEYCDEYKYYCYMELKKRFYGKDADKYAGNHELGEPQTAPTDIVEDEITDEEKTDLIESDEIVELLGVSPRCPNPGEFSPDWAEQLKALSTSEVLSRYDSDEWCEEYRYFCYIELKSRNDIAAVISGEQ